jgi:hydrogenase maturation protein HypF
VHNVRPRFTLIVDLPWARELTTKARFAPCPACRAEYENPHDRRFHAETTACAACGPALAFSRISGEGLDAGDPIAAAADRLIRGAIVAIKGVGGYHLACDATNDPAVRQLRRRKHRDARPFALMVADLEAVQDACVVSDAEAALLGSPARPIVLLRCRDGQLARITSSAPLACSDARLARGSSTTRASSTRPDVQSSRADRT